MELVFTRITERQSFEYFCIARKAKGTTSLVLLQLLEMHLDNILFRLGMAPTIPGAPTLLGHHHHRSIRLGQLPDLHTQVFHDLLVLRPRLFETTE